MNEKETNLKTGDLVAARALGNARFATKEPRTLPRTLTLLYIIVVFSAKIDICEEVPRSPIQ